jgi:hypothetical protein
MPARQEGAERCALKRKGIVGHKEKSTYKDSEPGCFDLGLRIFLNASISKPVATCTQ